MRNPTMRIRRSADPVSVRVNVTGNLAPSLSPEPDWQERIACRGLDFMTLSGREAEAKAVCSTCPVKLECLAWVKIEDPLIPGVIAGKTAEERGIRVCKHCGMIFRKGKMPRSDMCWACYDSTPLDKRNGAMVTMRDVAVVAGVSHNTVRNVLGSRPEARVSEKTRKKVLEAAEQLGYVYKGRYPLFKPDEQAS